MNLPRSRRSSSSAAPGKKLGRRKSSSSSASDAETEPRISTGKVALRPSAEQVALRAYFIAERRRSLGVHGDETSDWIAAERELLAELEPR
jgi:hypothetical protein